MRNALLMLLMLAVWLAPLLAGLWLALLAVLAAKREGFRKCVFHGVFSLLLIYVFAGPWTSCRRWLVSSEGDANRLRGAERRAVLAWAEPMADALFEGFGSGNYAEFSRHFDDALKSQRPAEQFVWEREQVMSDCGAYRWRKVSRVSRLSVGTARLDYRASFENGENVGVIVTFNDRADGRSIRFIRFFYPAKREQETTGYWVAKGQIFYHFRHCWHLREAAEVDLTRYETKEQARRPGFQTCPLCAPY